jgi:(p)ppGpp synthase/HD superfamily hydrolase
MNSQFGQPPDTEPSFDATLALIKRAHAGVFDDNGVPYEEHPIAVEKRLPPNAPLFVRNAAALHDTLEDCKHRGFSLAYLYSLGYSKQTRDIVELLTFSKDDHRPYHEKVQGIIDSGNLGAIWIKFCDMSENTREDRLLGLPPEKEQRLRRKYAEPIVLLRSALIQRGWLDFLPE